MAELFTNFAGSTLATGISAAQTSLTVQSGDGAKFPNPTGGDFFRIVIFKKSTGQKEILFCTTRSTDVFSVVSRGEESTTGLIFNAGDIVQLRPTAGFFSSLVVTDLNVQRKLFNYFLDTGSVNNIVITANPVPGSYQGGLQFDIKVLNTNTGAVVINVNAVGNVSIVKNKDTALEAGDIEAGQIITVQYDGTNFQMVPVLQPSVFGKSLALSAGAPAARTLLDVYSELEVDDQILEAGPNSATAAAKTSAAITNASQTNPVVITSVGHGRSNGDLVYLEDVGGMWQINDREFTAAGATTDTFQLSGENGLGHDTYTSGGKWTIDEYLAGFTPAISTLVDKMIVHVRSSQRNLTTTPIFKPDAVAAKNIVRPDQALAVGDISAGGTMTLQYHSSNDNWVLTNPYLGKPGQAVNNSNGNNNISDTELVAHSVITESQWESVGPTGGGADNTWTALNALPDDIDWIVIRIGCLAQNGTADSALSQNVNARRYRSTETATRVNEVSRIGDLANSSGNAFGQNLSTHKIPVNHRIFDMYWGSSFTINQIYVYVVDWGYNV